MSDELIAKEIKNELIEWIQHYFEENGSDSKAIIGISGGKDSSVVASLCVEALGKDRVFGVLMPNGQQYDIDVSISLCEHLDIDYRKINIGYIVDNVYAAVTEHEDSPPYNHGLNSIVTTNTPARVRMAVLYAVSAQIGGRVANTSNLSENYIGWNTKYGDSCGDFSPLANLTSTEVVAIGRELGLPHKFVYKVPEDGLTGKTDEENFGFSYAVLDRYIRDDVCEDKTVRIKIDEMRKRNLHKIKSMPSYRIKCKF